MTRRQQAPKIECFHGKLVHVVNTFGIVAYYHADDKSPCDQLNTLDVKPSQLLVDVINLYGLNSEKREVVVAVATSSCARQRMFDLLLEGTAETLPLLIQSAYTIIDHIRPDQGVSPNTVLQEYADRFGNVGAENFHIVTGTDIRKFVNFDPDAKSGGMIELTAADVMKAGIMPELAQQRDEIARQKIEDILSAF